MGDLNFGVIIIRSGMGSGRGKVKESKHWTSFRGGWTGWSIRIINVTMDEDMISVWWVLHTTNLASLGRADD